MKKQGTKLALGRETLASLTPDTLAGIHGGNVVTATSQLHCATRAGQRTCLLCMPDNDPK